MTTFQSAKARPGNLETAIQSVLLQEHTMQHTEHTSNKSEEEILHVSSASQPLHLTMTQNSKCFYLKYSALSAFTVSRGCEQQKTARLFPDSHALA